MARWLRQSIIYRNNDDAENCKRKNAFFSAPNIKISLSQWVNKVQLIFVSWWHRIKNSRLIRLCKYSRLFEWRVFQCNNHIASIFIFGSNCERGKKLRLIIESMYFICHSIKAHTRTSLCTDSRRWHMFGWKLFTSFDLWLESRDLANLKFIRLV